MSLVYFTFRVLGTKGYVKFICSPITLILRTMYLIPGGSIDFFKYHLLVRIMAIISMQIIDAQQKQPIVVILGRGYACAVNNNVSVIK